MTVIEVWCEEPSHDPVGCGQIRLAGALASTAGAETLVGDTAWADFWPQADTVGSTRGRHVFTCPDCGLRAEMRDETLQRLADGLIAAGVSRVSLRALQASLT